MLRQAALCAGLLLTLSSLPGCAYWPFGKDADGGQDAAREQPRIGLEVEGVSGAMAANVRAHVTLGSKVCTTAPGYVRALARRAEGEAAEALRAFGYYEASASVEVKREGDCPRAVIVVTPGERVRVRRVDLRITGAAADDDEFMSAFGEPPIRVGQGLNHKRYEDTKSKIESLALGRGYLDGRFVTSRLRVDVPAHAADVIIEWDSGPRYTVGEIRITQEPQVVDEALIRRFLDFEPDMAYDSGLVTRFYRALATSEYFQSVEVRPLLSSPEDHTIPVDIKLTPRKQHKYAAGLGASTDAGVRGRLNYVNRRLNERGHRLRGEMRASLIEQSLQGAWEIPREHPADEWLSVQAGVRRDNVSSFDSIGTQLGISETKRRPWGWMESHFINFNWQSFDIGGETRTSKLIVPGLRWNKVTSDDPLYPSRGYALDFEIRGAAEALLSDVSFARALLNARYVYSLPADLRLLTRAHLGASWVSDFERLPPSERFFAGGDNNLRGYDFQDLGPVNAQGRVVGGTYLAVGSVELEKSLTDSWGVAGFVDAGNAFGGEGSATGIKVGIGAGVRWRSPIGPARIDLAHPLDDDTLVRLHLRIGPDL
ncbi:MAG: autotransporter assembly complex family protein [Gammaproteobacteria bacterium]